MKTDYHDILELVMDMLNIEDYEHELDVWEALGLRFDIGMDEFHNVVEALMPHTPIVSSPLTNTKYHALMDKTGRFALVKVEAEG